MDGTVQGPQEIREDPSHDPAIPPLGVYQNGDQGLAEAPALPFSEPMIRSSQATEAVLTFVDGWVDKDNVAQTPWDRIQL